jgi:wobble nucleotide-excising tRNase
MTERGVTASGPARLIARRTSVQANLRRLADEGPGATDGVKRVVGINRIVRMRIPGVFRNFAWSADMLDFRRYNLIYGWNGSGKTTISRVFRALETQTAPTSGEVTLSINGSEVSGRDFARATLPVHVFNRDFVTESIFPVGGGDLPPIFVVGKENVEKQREIERLRDECAQAQTRLDPQRTKRDSTQKAFDNYCVERAKVIKETLRSSGRSAYSNYDKSQFQRRAEEMANSGNRVIHQRTDPERQQLLERHQATQKAEIGEVCYQPPIPETLAGTVSQLLKATVVSAAIESLKDDRTLSVWVHRGLELHHERHAERCLFCEQTLPKDRLAALDAHFTAEHGQLLGKLDAQIAQLQEESKAVDELSLPNRAELYEDLAQDYTSAETALRAALARTKAFFDLLVQALTDKKGRVFGSVKLDVTVPEVDSGAVDRLNEVIRKHNQACLNHLARAAEARQRLEADSVTGYLDQFLELRNAIQTCTTAVNGAEAEIRRLSAEIARLQREIVDHQKPADDLNEDLRKYLGHEELRLEVKDTGYAIARDGIPAQALSEGETTAIALLYFLKTLQDRRFELARGVVVLDDPVSSLDANALYLAFGFIRERTQHAGQLFILTHNFTFFREVRNWFHRVQGQNKRDIDVRPARLYMLECGRDGQQRCSNIRPLDRLLEQYESEYHYLFARIYREGRASTPASLEENYVLPNMARRLLEAFLGFRQPQVAGELWQKLKNVSFDEARKLRILRFLHTHSHGNVVGGPEHDPSLLSEARPVLADLLELIKAQDPGHYSAMVQLVDPPTDEGGDA